MRLRIEIEGIEGVNEAWKHCETAIILILNVFFFIEEVFVGAFRLAITTVTTGATATSNWWVVGVKRNFDRFYTLFGELLYYPQAKIYDHTLLTKQSYAFDA